MTIIQNYHYSCLRDRETYLPSSQRHENRNSFSTGEPENSGLRRMQLQGVSGVQQTPPYALLT